MEGDYITEVPVSERDWCRSYRAWTSSHHPDAIHHDVLTRAEREPEWWVKLLFTQCLSFGDFVIATQMRLRHWQLYGPGVSIFIFQIWTLSSGCLSALPKATQITQGSAGFSLSCLDPKALLAPPQKTIPCFCGWSSKCCKTNGQCLWGFADSCKLSELGTLLGLPRRLGSHVHRIAQCFHWTT